MELAISTGGWHEVLNKHGKTQYENLITGERQDTMPNIKKLTLGGMNMKKNMLRLEEDGLNWPGNTPFDIKKKLVGVLKSNREQVKLIKRYFNNMVHILCRKFEGGINPNKLSASNFARDALSAGHNGGGRYSRFKFHSKASIGILAPKLQKQIQRQEVELASILRKRKHRITTGVEAIITLIRNGVDFGQIDRECSSFVKNPLNYMTGKHRKLSPSSIRNNTNYLGSAGSTRKESPRGSEARNHNSSSGPQFSNSPNPVSPTASPVHSNIDNSEYELSYSPTSIVTTVDKDIASPNNLDSLEKAYDVELKNVIEERHGLIGELSQELIEINIHAKISMRCRTSKHAVDQSHESKHKLLMDSIKLVAKKRNKLATSMISGKQVSTGDQISALQVKLSKMKLEVAKARQETNDDKEAKAALMRQVLHIHSYMKKGGRKKHLQKKDSHTSLLINVNNNKPVRGIAVAHNIPTALQINVGNMYATAANSPSMSGALSNYHKYQHDLSTRFRKYERVEVKSRKYALGTILQQNDETGACTVILDKRGELIHNILPTQIVVKHTEKWPSHNFGDRVQATDYKITGLKYYLGTIQRRNNKTKEIDYVTYQIKFDDGEVINNILPFYIQKIFIP